MEHKEAYPKDGRQSVFHHDGGRRLGSKDYYHAEESKHLHSDAKKDSHYKQHFLLGD